MQISYDGEAGILLQIKGIVTIRKGEVITFVVQFLFLIFLCCRKSISQNVIVTEVKM